MKVPFKYKLRHWWYYLIPSYRRQVKTMNSMAEFWWRTVGQFHVEEYIKAALHQGVGLQAVDMEGLYDEHDQLGTDTGAEQSSPDTESSEDNTKTGHRPRKDPGGRQRVH